jgi:hypothetical protein
MFNDYFQFLICFLKKQINISVTVLSGSYVLLYYEQSLYVIIETSDEIKKNSERNIFMWILR